MIGIGAGPASFANGAVEGISRHYRRSAGPRASRTVTSGARDSVSRSDVMTLLRARLWHEVERVGAIAATRRRQVGSGMRGDKRRTIRYQDGSVTDHVTGRRWTVRAYE